MRAEAITGTNLFGYKERQNTSENDDVVPSVDTTEDNRKGRDNLISKGAGGQPSGNGVAN